MSTVVVRAKEPRDVEELRVDLAEAFSQVKTAVADGSSVVVIVAGDDLLGHRSPIRAAYVGALIGITRAVAFEGAKPGWKINTVAVPEPAQMSDEAAVAVVAVTGLSGQVVTLGTALVGKVLP